MYIKFGIGRLEVGPWIGQAGSLALLVQKQLNAQICILFFIGFETYFHLVIFLF
jgi:hypothetical protein